MVEIEHAVSSTKSPKVGFHSKNIPMKTKRRNLFLDKLSQMTHEKNYLPSLELARAHVLMSENLEDTQLYPEELLK